eukprot:UN05388
MTTLFSQNPPVYAQPNKKPAQQNAYKPPQSQFNNIVTNVNSQQQNTLELQKKSKLLHDVTQKMKTEVKKELDNLKIEIQTMMTKRTEVEDRKEQIQTSLKEGPIEQEKMNERKGELKNATEKIDIWLEKQSNEPIDVDAVVEAVDTHQKQLFETTDR